MGCDSGMMDVEGMRVYTCTPPIGGQPGRPDMSRERWGKVRDCSQGEGSLKGNGLGYSAGAQVGARASPPTQYFIGWVHFLGRFRVQNRKFPKKIS